MSRLVCAECAYKDRIILDLHETLARFKEPNHAKPRKIMAKAKPATAAMKAKWRKMVFQTWGPMCYFGGDHPAQDPAHIETAAKLGTAVAYKDARQGRPLCRVHHELQETHRIEFPLELRQEAIRVTNTFAVVPLPIPEA